MLNQRGYFGPADHKLFGATHRSSNAPAGAALLCAPFGEERKCAARLLFETATALQQDGIDTLRFDYSGTGDSPGTHAAATISGWQADCRVAAETLQGAVANAKITGIGARLGANLLLGCESAEGSPSSDTRIRRFVLWEPLPTGADYLDEMIRRKQIKEAIGAGQAGEYSRETLWQDSDVVDFDGFPISATMADELASLDLMATLNNLPDCHVLILHVTGARKLTLNWQRLADLCAERQGFELRVIHDKPFWGRLDHYQAEKLLNATRNFCLDT